MFGYYNDPRRPDPGDVLGSFFVFLFIIALIIGIALYFGSIILAIFLGIGAFIGFVYAIIVYIQAFVAACKTLRGVSGRNGLTSFLLKWWHLFKEASISAFKSNWAVAQSAFIKAGGYRFLSFRKWMWFVVAPTVLVIGTAMILLVAMMHLLFLFALLYILLCFLFAICLVYVIIAFGYAIARISCYCGADFSANNPFSALRFSKSFSFLDLGMFAKNYFSFLLKFVMQLLKDGVALIRSNFTSAIGYPTINLIRYFLFVSPVAIAPITLLFIVFVFVFVVIVFIPLFIIEFFWVIISKLFK